MNFLRRLWARPERYPSGLPTVEVIPTVDGTPMVVVTRGRRLVEELAVVRPNEVAAAIIRGTSGIYGAPGSIDFLGVNHNTRTGDGKDWQSDHMGGKPGAATGSPATATSATSLTVTGTPLVANALKGWRIYADNGTGSPVYGNIGSNTTSVITVDGWFNADDSAGSTPASTAAFILIPRAPARYIGLTTDTTAITGSETALTSEITTNGLARALATYAHTGGTTAYTLQKTWTASGASGTIHRAGLFTAATLTAGGNLAFISDLNADAVLASGDSLQVTWTINI